MKKTLLVLAIAAICALGACVPMFVFFAMDSVTIDQTFALADIPNVADISASDLPAVESIRRLLSANLTRAELLEMDAGAAAENGSIAYDETATVSGVDLEEVSSSISPNTLFENVSELMDSGALPAYVVKQMQETQKQQIPGFDDTLMCTMTVSAMQTFYSAEDIWEYMNGFSYTMEPDTRKIVSFSFHWLNVPTQVLRSSEREQLMRAYVTYLGLDILDDWEFNGHRLYSAKAGLYINIDYDTVYDRDFSYYSISVGL